MLYEFGPTAAVSAPWARGIDFILLFLETVLPLSRVHSCLANRYTNHAARSAVLSLDDGDEARTTQTKVARDDGAAPKRSTFYELQCIFSYLMLSDTQFFVPEGFWNS